jgi:Ras family protein
MLNSKHAIGIHGYIFVYSITSLNSLEMARTIRDKILNYTGTNWVPCVLVGNKSDLHMHRQESEEEGKELAARWKCKWTETSPKQDENIDQIFNMVIEQIEGSVNPGQESHDGSTFRVGSGLKGQGVWQKGAGE